MPLCKPSTTKKVECLKRGPKARAGQGAKMMFDLSDEMKRDFFVVQSKRWKYLSAFAYASFLYVGRGAVLIDLTQPTVQYIIPTNPGEKANLSPAMATQVEEYDPSTEVVCMLLFVLDAGKKLSFKRYRVSTSSPEENYQAAVETLSQEAPTPKLVMDLAWQHLCATFRLN